MNKKDILELKRRLKKDSCTFTRMCGCYVDGERNRVVKLEETFLNLEEEEFFKYLEIAKKVLSGAPGNNLIELEFPLQEESNGGKQQFLTALRASCLTNEDLLERFYDLIIDHYTYAGNYLILIFHDAYDVMAKSSDNRKLDESEEVYEYLLCAVCPVSLSKPALGYRADENRIGPRIRDWVVGAPESGFIFPAFTDRSTDIHSVLTYHKNPKEPHTELMEEILGCTAKRTAAEQKLAFSSIVKNSAGGDEEKARDIFNEIQQGISGFTESQTEESGSEPEPVLLTSDTICEILSETEIPKDDAAKIEASYTEEFQDEPPLLAHLIDPKAAEAGSRMRREKELIQKAAVLEQQLKDTRMLAGLPEDDGGPEHIKTYDVILRVKPEKASQIKSQIINGQKCLVIPMEENEHAAVNGVNTTV